MLRSNIGDNDFVLIVTQAFCDKIQNVDDVFVCGFFFPKIFSKGCAIYRPINTYQSMA